MLDKQFPVYSEAGKKVVVEHTTLEVDPSYVVVKTGKYGKVEFSKVFVLNNFVFYASS